MPRPGIYTKAELRIEKQREKDDYEFWHGPAEELTAREVMLLSVQTLADQHDRDAEKYYRETGEHLPDFDTSRLSRLVHDEQVEQSRRRIQNDIEAMRERKEEFARQLFLNGTLWDYADKVFPAAIISEYPVVQCYSSPGADYPVWPIRRGSADDVYEPEWCFIVALKESKRMEKADIMKMVFPRGTLIYNGKSIGWLMRKIQNEGV